MLKYLMIGTLAAFACASPTVAQRQPAPVRGFKVVATFPHDPAAFTQGLVFSDGEFYESTGLNGESSLRRVEVSTPRNITGARGSCPSETPIVRVVGKCSS